MLSQEFRFDNYETYEVEFTCNETCLWICLSVCQLQLYIKDISMVFLIFVRKYSQQHFKKTDKVQF